MRITLTMDEEIAEILMDATEFYSRVLCGQFDEIARKVAQAQYERLKEKEDPEGNKVNIPELCAVERKAEKAFLWPKKVQFPELDGTGQYGLGYTRTTDISFNIYQAVRYALAWHRSPEGGWTVDFHTPSADNRPIPRVDIDGKTYIEGNVAHKKRRAHE